MRRHSSLLRTSAHKQPVQDERRGSNNNGTIGGGRQPAIATQYASRCPEDRKYTSYWQHADVGPRRHKHSAEVTKSACIISVLMSLSPHTSVTEPASRTTVG